MVKDIKIEDFAYDLPDERIARHPLAERDSCKLLLSRPDGKISHQKFKELPDLLPPGTMLVCNDTRVINARLTFHKSTGSRIEIFLLEPESPSDYVLNFQTTDRCVWKCLVGNLKKWKKGKTCDGGRRTYDEEGTGYEVLCIELGDTILRARRLGEGEANTQHIEFSWDNPKITFAAITEMAGAIPIPPYLKRESEESDREDYQTVYADERGSVAAPTAGLHFTNTLFKAIQSHAIKIEKLTLHVGAGTFKPVKSEEIGDHAMHTETFSVTKSFIRNLVSQKKSGSPVAAVGTTSVRTLESLPYLGLSLLEGKRDLHVGQWTAYESKDFDTIKALEAIIEYMEGESLEQLTGSTAIMIAPGFNWRITDVMITNFHQPRSTLLLLVSSFLQGNKSEEGKPQWRKIYEEALMHDYRFLSYGDACLFLPIMN